MVLHIDVTSDVPLVQQIVQSVRAEAAAGKLRPGDQLPAARDLAVSLDIHLHTVLHAYQLLREEGLVDLRRGRGAVVTAAAAGLVGLEEDIIALTRKARELGLSAETLVELVREQAVTGAQGPRAAPA